MAAQPIVVTSYKDPLETITSNVIGTTNVLEALRIVNHNCVAVVITSDKCYDNVEWVWGYKETDHMGGKDIYSGSKGAAEIIFKSYYQSFFKNTEKYNVKTVSVRAGNVIGGGDWADYRIVPDCVRAWVNGDSVEIRSPKATRPWQHVLEPLSGYLTVAAELADKISLNGESFNFGPHAEYTKTVRELLNDLSTYWNLEQAPSYLSETLSEFHEAGLLKLNCDKALFYLKWLPTLSYDKLIEFTSLWYYNFYNKSSTMFDFTLNQIREYEQIATEKQVSWSM
jgi:CDP-glucose 4,6-dehydratase